VHFVYIVRCADGTLYTGYARDPVARERAHNSGRGAKYTAGRRPVRLVYQEAFRSVRKALAREYVVKHLTRAQKNALVARQRRGQNAAVRVLLLAALLLVSASAGAADLRITDSRGTDVVVQSAAIDYGGFVASDIETQGIRLLQGDGSVMVKWADIETLKVTRRDESVKPPRIELEVVLKTQKKVPAALFRQGRMKLTGKTELGEYSIDLEKVRTITPLK